MYGYLFFYLFIPMMLGALILGLLGMYLGTGMSFLDFLSVFTNRGTKLTCWHCKKETLANRKTCQHCGEELQ